MESQGRSSSGSGSVLNTTIVDQQQLHATKYFANHKNTQMASFKVMNEEEWQGGWSVQGTGDTLTAKMAALMKDKEAKEAAEKAELKRLVLAANDRE